MGEDASWDLIYKTLYKVVDSFPKYNFENEDKFGSFVFRIFINYLRNYYRDHKKEFEDVQLADIDPDKIAYSQSSSFSPDQPADPRMKILNAELDKMEDWQRILLLMRSDGRPYADIAQYVDKPEEQLKVYYQRLKKLLTDKINEQVQ
jgi:RNA polymerase sigma factor (sigma-70 family)